MRVSDAWAALTAAIGVRGVPLRAVVVDANDGIIATAGIVEGFIGAGFDRGAMFLATFFALVAGAISIGAARYGEAAAARDEIVATLAEEQRRISLDPAEELAELADHYRAKGLPADLADQVAAALTRADPVRAHAEAEYGIDPADAITNPVMVGVLAGAGFGLGALIPLVTASLAEEGRRALLTFVAVIVSLTITAFVQARAGHTAVARTVVRTVLIGVVAMGVTYAIGLLIQR